MAYLGVYSTPKQAERENPNMKPGDIFDLDDVGHHPGFPEYYTQYTFDGTGYSATPVLKSERNNSAQNNNNGGGTYTVSGITYDITTGLPTYVPPDLQTTVTIVPSNSTNSSSSSSGLSERELLRRLVFAEVGFSQDLVGAAAVAKSIFNRVAILQSGAPPSLFNAECASITCVIQGKDQYQPYAQGKLNRELSPEESQFIEKGIKIAENSSALRGYFEAAGKTPEEINKLAGATGFRNYDLAYIDKSQQVNEVVLNNHTFNTAGNPNLEEFVIQASDSTFTGSTDSTGSEVIYGDSEDVVIFDSGRTDPGQPGNPIHSGDTNWQPRNPDIANLSDKELQEKYNENVRANNNLPFIRNSTDLWSSDEWEQYNTLKDEREALKNDAKIRKYCETNAKETPIGSYFNKTPECETLLSSVDADTVFHTDQEILLPDPCGTSTVSQINTALTNLFTALKGIKKYGQLYVMGGINKLKGVASLVKNASNIIASVLKILVQRMRDWMLNKIRKGIGDLIEKVLPTLAKALKNALLQQIINNILCKFKDVVNGLVDMVSDFLFELIGKVVNAPFCAAQQFTNALINNLAAKLDSELGPILDEITDVMGKASKIAGSIFEALDFILGFESFLCAKPNCPEIKSFKAGPWGGPSKAQIDAFNAFTIPTGNEVIDEVSNWIDGVEIFSEKVGDVAGGSIPSSITKCDTNPFKCGIPKIDIFGGGGLGAVGEAVVSKTGRILGVNLINGGYGFETVPFVTITDSCKDGDFASAHAEIDMDSNSSTYSQVTRIIIDEPGQGYNNTFDGTDEFDDPDDKINIGTIPEVIPTKGGIGDIGTGIGDIGTGTGDIGTGTGISDIDTGISVSNNQVNDYIVCLDEIQIIGTGNGYTEEDAIEVTSEIENLEANVKMTPFGQIVSIEVLNSVCGITDIPEITINSNTGGGVKIKPILSFIKLEDSDQIKDPRLDKPVVDVNIKRGDTLIKSIAQKNIVRVIDCV